MFALFATSPAAGQDSLDSWTRFRGPNGTGISPAKTIPVTWTEKDYHWKVALPGKGHSSPVVWGDYLFVTAGEEASAKRIVVCVRCRDGSMVWQRDYASRTFAQNRDNSFATSTPAVDADHVYIYWTTPEQLTVLALDHQGKQVWQRQLGQFTSRHGSGTSPMVWEDMIILGNDQEGASSLFALDRRTGETRWQIDRKKDQAAYATPFILPSTTGAPQIIFSSSGHGLTALEPRTGKTQWEFAKAFPFRVVGSPVAGSGLIVGSCGEGGIGRRFVAVRPPAPQPGAQPQLAYELKTSIPYVPTPLIKDDRLFLWGDNGVVSCLRVASGEKVWQGRVNDSFYGSPVWADGRLYCVSKAGVVHVLAAGDTFQPLAQNPLGEGSHGTPAIAHGVMYLRTFKHLISIGGAKS